MALVGNPINVLQLKFDVFTFRDESKSCEYWSDGKHIVAKDSTCRCGKKFMLCEVSK